jgi:aquaporin Z
LAPAGDHRGLRDLRFELPGLDFSDYWVYVAGPLAGAGIAVLLAFVLRGYGGGRSGSAAAQGDLGTEVSRPGQA